MAESRHVSGSIAKISENITILKCLDGQNLTPSPQQEIISIFMLRNKTIWCWSVILNGTFFLCDDMIEKVLRVACQKLTIINILKYFKEKIISCLTVEKVYKEERIAVWCSRRYSLQFCCYWRRGWWFECLCCGSKLKCKRLLN